MISVRFYLVLACGLAMCIACPALVVAKDKPAKIAAVKIIKPSETRFKEANIVKKEKKRKARFLWFGKKKEKVIEVRKAPIARVGAPKPAVINPTVSQPEEALESSERDAKVVRPKTDDRKKLLEIPQLDEAEITVPSETQDAEK